TRTGRIELRAEIERIAEHLVSPTAAVADSADATRLVYAELMRGTDDARLALVPDRYQEQLAGDLSDAFFDLDGAAAGLGGDEDPAGDSDDGRPPTPVATDRVPLELAAERGTPTRGIPVDPAELLRLLEQGADVAIRQQTGEDL